MKKILFTLLLVAGAFGVQAQDLPNVEFTLFNGGAYGLAVGENVEDNRCVTIKESDNTNSAITQVGNTLIYTMDQLGQLRRNGSTIGLPNVAFIRSFRSGEFNRLYTKGSNNRYTGANIN